MIDVSTLSSPSASEDDSSLASSPGGSMVLDVRLLGSQRNMRIEIHSVEVTVLTLAVSKRDR